MLPLQRPYKNLVTPIFIQWLSESEIVNIASMEVMVSDLETWSKDLLPLISYIFTASLIMSLSLHLIHHHHHRHHHRHHHHHHHHHQQLTLLSFPKFIGGAERGGLLWASSSSTQLMTHCIIHSSTLYTMCYTLYTGPSPTQLMTQRHIAPETFPLENMWPSKP